MEFQVAETVEELEAQHSVLKKQIAQLVDRASVGQANPDDIVTLTRRAAALATRIESHKAERQRAENERQRREQERTRAELPKVLATALEKREEFLSHYRAACIALGKYLESQSRANVLTNQLSGPFGVPLLDRNALCELELGDKPRQILEGLRPDLDGAWKMSFPVTPMYDK
jgi:hypothetical protein